MTKNVQLMLIFIATAITTVGYFLAGLIPPALVSLAIFIIWLVAAWRSWTWLVNLAFVFLLLNSGVGIWLNLPAAFMVISVVCGVLAWDLYYFRLHIQNAVPEDGISRLEGNHLLRLGLLGLFSLGLCILILNLRYQFTFEWILIISILIIGGIAALTGFLRKTN